MQRLPDCGNFAFFGRGAKKTSELTNGRTDKSGKAPGMFGLKSKFVFDVRLFFAFGNYPPNTSTFIFSKNTTLLLGCLLGSVDFGLVRFWQDDLLSGS